MTSPLPSVRADAEAGADAVDGFVAALAEAVSADRFAKLVLARPCASAAGALRVDARPVRLQGASRIAWVVRQPTRDLQSNLAPSDAIVETRALLLASAFAHARLDTHGGTVELLTSRKGRRTLLRRKMPGHEARADVETPEARDRSVAEPHDRPKHRFVALDRPYLQALGVADASHRLVPAMARKWRQIDKFVELLDGALDATGLKAPGARPAVVDFGAGKGYLTFAAHDHLRHALGLEATVLGVELRGELVEFCEGAARRLGADGLRFEQGDIRSVEPPAVDVMIALHACDTATDVAIATGVAAGAKVIMCSPCCHRELRPQLLAPHPLRPILKHGVHLAQQAEMLTDGLRALVLEACGYDTKVFEFVALEHTNKNKMILAERRAGRDPAGEARRQTEAGTQIDALKRFYGIREQCLERLLHDRLAPSLETDAA